MLYNQQSMSGLSPLFSKGTSEIVRSPLPFPDVGTSYTAEDDSWNWPNENSRSCYLSVFVHGSMWIALWIGQISAVEKMIFTYTSNSMLLKTYGKDTPTKTSNSILCLILNLLIKKLKLREFGDECVFNETIGQSHYNRYSSSKYSNANRTFYLALNQRGQSRRVVLRAGKQLGKLASYILVLTRPVAPELQLHPMRHHAHACPLPAAHQAPKVHHHQQLCPKKRKRKKKRRKCAGDENDFESCQKKLNSPKQKAQNRNNHKCDDDKTSEMCQRDLNNRKKQKFSNSDKLLVSDPKKKRKNKKGVKKRLNQFESETTTTTTAPTSTTLEYSTPDEDYGVDMSTHADWEDSTALLDVQMAVSDAMHTAPPLIDSD